jgi:acyl-CoA synthetase (AMP-forming)/AMP-acid ligase II
MGEICIRSPWVMAGYWRDPELTASVLVDGWVRTGDAGHLDGEGRLYIVGRLKAMIKRGGENVSAREVESVVETHPDVAECACFSVPDPITTEEVKIAVVLREGATVTPDELVDFCLPRLAAFKVPRYWDIRDTMPRTRSMKAAITELQAAHASDPGWDRSAHPKEVSSA